MTREEFNQIAKKSIVTMMMFTIPVALTFIFWGFFNVISGGADASFVFLGLNILLIGAIAALGQTLIYMFLLALIRRYPRDNTKFAIFLSTMISLAINVSFFLILMSPLQLSLGIIFMMIMLTLPAFHTVSAPFILAHHASKVLLPNEKPKMKEIEATEEDFNTRHHQQRRARLEKQKQEAGELEFSSGVHGGKEGVKLKKSKRKPKNDTDYSEYFLEEEKKYMEKRK